MRSLSVCGVAILLVSLAATPAFSKEAQVDVTGVHLCCQKCVNAVADALTKLVRELLRVDAKPSTLVALTLRTDELRHAGGRDQDDAERRRR